MAGTIIVGAQWGDEGKGKVTDFFAEKSDYVVRYQGGNNAGHTVVANGKTYKFHLIPSGAVQGKKCFLGAGVVLDPRVLVKELEQFGKVDLVIDPRVQIIMPYHVALDSISELKSGAKKIGTTGRGIGPCYSDRASRQGVRFIELVDEAALRKKLEEVLPMKLSILKNAFGVDVDFDLESIVAEYSALGKSLKPYFGDVSAEIYNALNSNKNVLFEGAQGTFLDNDFGTYPYVTSSHPLAGGVFCGVGIGVTNFSRIIGIAKAYTTRVGEGPFPAELFDSVGETMRKVGVEFGTTTGRPRRVGWLDLNILRTAKRLNGFSELAITKLDVLCGLEKLLVGVAYDIDGVETKDVPVSLDEVARAKVVYKEFKGFNFEPDKVKTFADLPKEAQDYILFIEKEVGVKASIVSVGPSREQTIIR